MAVVLLLVLASPGLDARRRRPRRNQSTEFSHYLLVLSYSPDFCAQPGGNKDERQCGIGRHTGFVVHGLWPQGELTRGPIGCVSSETIPGDVITAMLRYFPTAKLIQHEWETHGTCSGLSVREYFARVKQARDAVKIPVALTPTQPATLTPSQIEEAAAQANPAYPREAFRATCYRDQELQELRICLTKELAPRACGPSAGRCMAEQVTLLPLR